MAETETKNLLTAAHTLGLQLRVLHASTEGDFDTVFATLAELRAGGLVIGNDLFFNSRLDQLAALTVRHTLPAVHQFRQFAGVRWPNELWNQFYRCVPTGACGAKNEYPARVCLR